MKDIENKIGIAPKIRDEFYLRDKAMAGDMVWVVTPATVTPIPTAVAWTRTVVVELQTAAGEVHEWFDKAITTGNSIADDSDAGTATIVSTTLTIEKGRAEVVVSGDEAAWLTTETDTYTVSEATILGYTIAAATSVEEFTAI